MRRPSRAAVLTTQTVLAVALAGAAARSVPGHVVAGIALAAGLALLVRPHGRGLLDVVRERLREPREDGGPPPDLPSDPGPARPDLGAPLRLLPRLHVVDVPTRRAGPVGVAGDGQGFVVALDTAVSPVTAWDFGDVVERVLADPARPAAVQLLVEQRGARRAGGHAGFAPARSYRSLPTGGIPLWSRAVVVVRHEPAWAPETVAARGDGAAGARAALVAVAARLVHAGATGAIGTVLRPLGAPALAALFRDLGDPGPDCAAREQAWTTSTACHATGAVPLTGPDSLATVLDALAELDVDRCVVSLAVSAVDHTASGTVRVVAPDLDHVAAALDTLVERGLAAPLPGLQEAGLVATLPLGGGARSLARLVDQVR